VGYRVIGSPTDSGSVSLGSSPGTPARQDDPGAVAQRRVVSLLPCGFTPAAEVPPGARTPAPRFAGRGPGIRWFVGHVLIQAADQPQWPVLAPPAKRRYGVPRWGCGTPGDISAPSSRGLGRRPLKAVTPVRIRSGLLVRGPLLALYASRGPRSVSAGGRPPSPRLRALPEGAGLVSLVVLVESAGGTGAGHLSE
jgi:hypothetical protein